MGRFEDRQRAQEYIDELRMMAGSNVAATSPDARLAAWTAVAQAQAIVVFSVSVQQATETLMHDILPEFGRTLGGR